MIFEEQQHWQIQRLGKFTASELWKLFQSGRGKGGYFGKGAKTYIREKLAEILTGQITRDLTGLNSIEWGQANEHAAIKAFQEQFQIPELTYFGGGYPAFFEYNQYSGGSPDGLTESHVIEVKCPYNSGIHIDNLIGAKQSDPLSWFIDNRPEYYTQIQFNMMCCNKNKGCFVSFDPRISDSDKQLAVIEIICNEPFQTEIINRIDRAVSLIKDHLSLLDNTPSTLLAERDPEINATIIMPAFEPSLLKKI